ncbi:uncharacterized protein LOC106134401 [Amyelois transitella]|uniref:uncharacterized protein LOC106134401 n=1 Tax=Amyelois transitella TaxID=680683 RepID=UPI00298FAD17|nr:uncharacterized protein LOC106134401 [Amyelois transitella]
MWSKVRKFGLEHCDLPTMVENSSVLLRVLSLNLNPLQEKKIPLIFYVFTVIVFSSYIYVYVFSMSWFVFWKSQETGDVISAMVIFSLGVSSEISTIKFLYMFVNQNSLRSLIGKYLSYDSKSIPNSKTAKKVRAVLRGTKKTAMTFWLIVMGNGLVYCIKPLLLPGRHLMEDIAFLFGLDPLFESPYYEIGYILSLNACIFTVYATANISAFFVIVTGYIEAQMLSLSEAVVNVWEDAQDFYYQNNNVSENVFSNQTETKITDKDIILNEYVRGQLFVIINNHTTNINLLYKIEEVFNSSLAIEFGLLMISLIAEFLGGIENTYILMPFALVQVTMDCIAGQKLLDSSNVFRRAVYESKWENFDVKNMKTVLMMLTNSQKDMTLTVGGLRTLSFLCLLDVFRMIYSTYTALRSMFNR